MTRKYNHTDRPDRASDHYIHNEYASDVDALIAEESARYDRLPKQAKKNPRIVWACRVYDEFMDSVCDISDEEYARNNTYACYLESQADTLYYSKAQRRSDKAGGVIAAQEG